MEVDAVSSKKSPSVFEIYAREYDWITDALSREKYHRKEVAALIRRFKPRTVLDAGCATGLTTRLFADAGVAAVGLDRSRQMLDVARSKYGEGAREISFRYGNFERLPKKLHGKFDMVVCLANGISGVETVARLRKSLRGFRSVLTDGGTLVLQMLNYAAVAEGKLMPVRATVHDGIVYERFTERVGKRLSLYVTRLDMREKPPRLEVFRHQFDNFTEDLVNREIQKVGFGHILKYSDLYLIKKFRKSSRDLVITATR
jgi:ubiquinone/menaquinone biosynthesis C-methylase UbiE